MILNRKILVKLFFTASVVMIMLMAFCVKPHAEKKTGSCGVSVQYEYDSETENLRIFGTGPMYDFSGESQPPWRYEMIDEVVIEEGVTSIGADSFYNQHYVDDDGGIFVSSVVIPESCTSIGYSAFMMSDLKTVTIPAGTKVGNLAFMNCTSLNSITIKGEEVGVNAFAICFGDAKILKSTKLTLSENCKSIGDCAFWGRRINDGIVRLPASLESIGVNAIGYYNSEEKGLIQDKSITFVGKKDSLAYEYAKKYEFAFQLEGYKSLKGFKAKNTKNKKIAISWKRDKKASGYQVAYSRKKDFSSGVKYINIKGSKKTSATIRKLSKKKTYYVRVRAYKKSDGVKCYSEWTSKKAIKIKK